MAPPLGSHLQQAAMPKHGLTNKARQYLSLDPFGRATGGGYVEDVGVKRLVRAITNAGLTFALRSSSIASQAMHHSLPPRGESYSRVYFKVLATMLSHSENPIGREVLVVSYGRNSCLG